MFRVVITHAKRNSTLSPLVTKVVRTSASHAEDLGSISSSSQNNGFNLATLNSKKGGLKLAPVT